MLPRDKAIAAVSFINVLVKKSECKSNVKKRNIFLENGIAVLPRIRCHSSNLRKSREHSSPESATLDQNVWCVAKDGQGVILA